MIFGTCLLAIAVNLCSFGLIGKTSAVTYQVVGHAKTCLVLIGGFIMMPTNASSSDLLKNIIGVIIAFLGVLLYSYYNLQDSIAVEERRKQQEALKNSDNKV